MTKTEYVQLLKEAEEEADKYGDNDITDAFNHTLVVDDHHQNGIVAITKYKDVPVSMCWVITPPETAKLMEAVNEFLSPFTVERTDIVENEWYEKNKKRAYQAVLRVTGGFTKDE